MRFSPAIGCLLVVAAFTFTAYGQKPAAVAPNFDVADFSKKFETVQWLVEYDEVAWKTTDVVMTEDRTGLAKLGHEWFCFQDSKSTWHAVYGKLEGQNFNAVFHYTYASGKVSRSTEKLDQKFLDLHALALKSAALKLASQLRAGAPKFNQYIRRNPDQTFDVWMLPAFQPDGTAVFGGEAHYLFDASAIKLLSEDNYFQPDFRGFKSQPAREIWLNYRELEKPTLGTIFFVWYYKDYFTRIFIDNAKSTSTVIMDPKGHYIWIHVEREQKPVPSPVKPSS
jgi:hypothetical protein